ncbi:hypothetical protein BJAS_P3425 [Bathymodiolus japonicus methanotrophic gill symbiont]|uniref:hypothetical protein n=1 Tax=Bathymodiolus japonicus methanotrophic gill symbiont TaxID=113269 RepID=UPI001B5986DB|nr:hypothetical protein [Bathymodiolus japonicus methanotrophic gill symbiont]GFO72889.1 hypothetical protein BJAS_P3425 [Bathymodiolus japonicus methanotrophic gill symbiont]
MKKLLTALLLSTLSLSAFAHHDETNDAEHEAGYLYTYSCGEDNFENLESIYLYLHDTKYIQQADAIKDDSSVCNIVAFAIDPSFKDGWVTNDKFDSILEDGRAMGVPFYIEAN